MKTKLHPIKRHIVDFYCDEYGIIPEPDGPYHNNADQQLKDKARVTYLNRPGYKVLRFSNLTALYDPGVILEKINMAKRSQEKYKASKSGAPKSDGTISILSTKKLKASNKAALQNGGVKVSEYEAITISYLKTEIPSGYDRLIFTSQNGVKAYLYSASKTSPAWEYLKKPCFCVGGKTQSLLEKNGFQVAYMASSALELGNYLVKHDRTASYLWVCSSRRRPELPELFAREGLLLKEVVGYKTYLNPAKQEEHFNGVLFFSPSGVESFFRENSLGKGIALCIGPTTATAAKKYTNQFKMSEEPSEESLVAMAIDALSSLSSLKTNPSKEE